MSSINRFAVAIVAFLGMVVVAASFSSSAGAAPYNKAPKLSVSDQNPRQSGTETVSGTGYAANEVVTITLVANNKTYVLGTVAANSSGAFSTTVHLPAAATGDATITGTGSTGDTASVKIKIGNTKLAAVSFNTDGNGAGSTTGLAVLGVTGLGIALLVGYGFVMLNTKRRKVSD